MGMYATFKEIPASTLAALLRAPGDAAFVDSVLFTDDGGWKAFETPLTDAELRQRFDCSSLPVAIEDMRTFGELDCGKYGDEEAWPVFDYLLRALELGEEHHVAYLLTAMHAAAQPGNDFAAIFSALAERFAEPVGPPRPAEPTWITSAGEPRYGFSSSVPCYGILGVTEPAAIDATWRRLRTGLERWPAQRKALIAAFAPDLAFYYGAAARGSAALSVMW